ncbi:potassium channel family protein [Ornithinimicrobium faecis]|uniref:Potassium channel family protein n=1 Tax=Ornithinimicrobium faecis TaxID=2934158 RepID=A0ABY4YQ28_9MICO|nr:ion channel [Ornithinimicrobium sp. HY1793]USQ78883.1 potassium channel family protein [Ornithinimicrobium sp. HY1793]
MFTYAGAAGQSRPQRWLSGLRDHPSAVLLAVQLLGVLVFPFTDQGGLGRTLLSAFGLIVLAIAVLAVNKTPATRRVAIVLGAPVFVMTIVEAVFPTHEGVLLTSYVFHGTFYFYTAISLLRYMFADAWVSRDELFATGACFTVLAWAFAYTHGIVQVIWPGSYIHTGHEGPLSWMDLLFLSFTTLTNTGLSDISPGPDAGHARAVLMLQMLAGLNYMALVVARLLGLTMIKFRR